MDAALNQACANLNAFVEESLRNVGIVSQAITPTKDWVQMIEQSTSVLQRRWQEAIEQPETIKAATAQALKAGESLHEIQTASTSLLKQSNDQWVEATFNMAQAWTQMLWGAPVISWEEGAARWINQSVDSAKQLQQLSGDHATRLNTIQAAYKAWLQSTYLAG